MKLLFDFFPIILFFVTFKFKGIFAATAVAMAVSALQIIWVYARHKKVEPMLWISLGVITVFGGATLLLHNEQFIKMKPTVLYWVFAAIILGSEAISGKNIVRSLMKTQVELTEAGWRTLNISWGVFFAVVGAVNLFVARLCSTAVWVNFKLFGILGLMLVFVVIQALVLARHMQPTPPA